MNVKALKRQNGSNSPRRPGTGSGQPAPAPSVRIPFRVQDPRAFGKVAVLLGGTSAEREVSLQSGSTVLGALQHAGIDAHAVDPRGDVVRRLEAEHFQRAFIVLHGRGGEDGTLQGALEVAGIPYTGSGVLGSALAMDKRRTKLIWQAAGVPTPPFRMVAKEADVRVAAAALGFPLMIKPVHEGSSIGAARVDDAAQLQPAWRLASREDAEVMVERWVDGIEYTAAVLGREMLPLIRLETPRVFYDYQAKYADGAGTEYICPCGLDSRHEAQLQSLALRAFDAVGASGWGRVDFLCDETGSPTFLEVNTSPGMTSHSLVPMAARAAGMTLEQLVWRILETSLK